MSELKATPGPWNIKLDGGNTHIIANGESIMCDEQFYPWVPENNHDWDLMAASRDMYQALENSLDCITDMGVKQEILNAMARARGEQ